MDNILITSAGQRVSLVRAFQKELRKHNEKGKVYTVDLNPMLAPACQVSDGYKSVPRVTDDRYIAEVLKICEAWGIKMIIPTIDTELLMLAENKSKFEDRGIHAVVSDLDFIRACRDKRIINQFFLDNGIEIPKKISKENPTFPLFIKPYDGSLSKDTFLIESAEDLTDYHFQNKKLMFMEYMNPEEYDEYTVDTYYDKKGKLKCVVPRKRIFVRAGEVNKGLAEKNEIVNFVEEKLGSIEGARGCLTMQFFLGNTNRRIVGIEINSRFGGGYPLSYLAGANFPKWLIEEYFQNEKIEYTDDWEDKLLMLRYDDEVLVHGYEG